MRNEDVAGERVRVMEWRVALQLPNSPAVCSWMASELANLFLVITQSVVRPPFQECVHSRDFSNSTVDDSCGSDVPIDDELILSQGPSCIFAHVLCWQGTAEGNLPGVRIRGRDTEACTDVMGAFFELRACVVDV